LLRFFKRVGFQCKNISPDWPKFTASRRQICISVEVFLQRHTAPRLKMVSAKLINALQVHQVLRQQPWLAGRGKKSTPRFSYADTGAHCAYISVTDKDHSAILWRANKFCVRTAANSCKSGEPILHREGPYIKSCSFLTDNFKKH
jgi:hypothetical protein